MQVYDHSPRHWSSNKWSKHGRSIFQLSGDRCGYLGDIYTYVDSISYQARTALQRSINKMSAKQSAETREAIRLFKSGVSPRNAAKKAGVEYTTLIRALQKLLSGKQVNHG